MLGLAGLLGVLMVGMSLDVGDLVSRVTGNDDESNDNDDAQEDALIEGTDEGETLTGTDGADSILAYLGNDVAWGGDGDDMLDGGAGDDDLFGAEDNDTLIGGEGDDQLEGDLGDDTLDGGEGDDELLGQAGDDILTGGAGQDTLIGGPGSDWLNGGDGDDGVMGGEGDDIVMGGAGADNVNGNLGNDVIVGAETLDDEITDDGVRDYLNAGEGDDVLVLGGDDYATGDLGADQFTVGDWIAEDNPAYIADFNSDEDALVVLYDDAAHPDPEVTVEASETDPDSVLVFLDGLLLTEVAGGEGLEPDQITLVAGSTLSAAMAA